MPKALNVHITFEEAMRLHLGIGEALAKLNKYDRSTKEGRQSAVNMCIFLEKHRITTNEGKGNDDDVDDPPNDDERGWSITGQLTVPPRNGDRS